MWRIKNAGLGVLIMLLACMGPETSKNADLSTPPTTTNQEFTIKSGDLDTIIKDFTPDYLTGHFDPAHHADFVLIDTAHADRAGLYLRQDTYSAFKEMFAAAQENHIKLVIRSATRNFEAQKRIWERKWEGKTKLEGKIYATQIADPVERAKEILLYSSMPGTSRHHWGTDIDLNAFSNSYFESGAGQKIYQWLLENAEKYGFCQPYTAKGLNRPNGYEEEKWHWSYLPVAIPLTHKAKKSLSDDQISGFKGAEVAQTIRVVENYVLGINPDCFLAN